MRGRSKKALVAAGVTLAVAAGAGGAVAAGGNGRHGHSGPAAIATYLGLTPAQLREQLRSGKTLAQIAVAQGKTVSGLEAAIYADVQAHLDRAVAGGRLSAAQEQAILTRLKSRLDDLVNHAVPALARQPLHPRLGGAVTTYLGVTPAQLQAELRTGKSLAQIATEHGKTVAGLKSAILDAVKARLDKAVASGRLSTAQEKTILDRLSAHLDQLVNRTRSLAKA
jgi:uncharacterized coiled-coil protein SlyX